MIHATGHSTDATTGFVSRVALVLVFFYDRSRIYVLDCLEMLIYQGPFIHLLKLHLW